jgi:large subunit ribosomal protein L29
VTQKARALREQSTEALKQELEQAHQGMFNLRFQASTRQLADNSQIAKARKQIARIKTLLAERQAAESGK